MGVAVLSRWPVLRVQQHRLPAAHRAEPVALLTTLGHPLGPLHVMASCVEWEPEFAEDHLAQTRALARLLVDPALDGTLPVLLAADLNAALETPQIQALTDVMVDAWNAGGGDGEGATLSSHNPFAHGKQCSRSTGVSTTCWSGRAPPSNACPCGGAFIAGAAVDGLYPSDHYAVVADLTP